MSSRTRTSRMIPAPEAYGALFAAALASLPGHARPEIETLRRRSFERFRSLGFPGPKVEAWKYSPVGGIAREAMRPAPGADLGAADIAPYLVTDAGVRRMVVVNGQFRADLSDAGSQGDGILVTSLAAALADGRVDAGDILAEDDASGRGFGALNAAFAAGGVVVDLRDGAALDGPVQLLFVSDGADGEQPTMANPRNLVRLGDGARLDLVETHLFRDDSRRLTNLVTRVELGEAAELRHDRLQIGDLGGRFIGRIECRLAAKARLTQTLATLGGGFVRNEVAAVLDGAGIEAQFNGLYLTRTGQHIDNMLHIDHVGPNSHSDQYYRGVLDGRARAAFAGKIKVHRPAQKTNAFQTNNNLLLSPDAEINTKPELEIYADDVKCSHGATAGELDEQELFYLRSRGLDPATARTMLTFAFAGAVLERFTNSCLLGQAKREILRWLPGGESLEELA